MAIFYGTSTGSAASAYTLWLECVINSQNVANNTSNVTLSLKCQRTDGSTGGYSYSGSGSNYASIAMTGETGSPRSDIGTVDLTNKQIEILKTWTEDVAHNADGTKTLAVSAAWDNNKSTYLSGGSVSGNWTLTTIPRASTPSIPNFTIGNSAISIATNRANAAFTHTLSYKFATQSSFTQFATGVGASYSWDTSGLISTLCNLIPNSTSGVMTIECKTYNGGTLIGTKTSTCTASVNTTTCKPTLTITAVDVRSTTINLTGDANKIIKGESTGRITPTVTFKYGATVAGIYIQMGTKMYTSGSIPTYHDFLNVDGGNVVVDVTDSRGLTTEVTLSKTLINYAKPAISSMTVKRTTPTGTTVDLALTGSWFTGSFGSATNYFTLYYKYKKTTDSTWSSAVYLCLSASSYTFTTNTLTGPFDALYAYDIQITYYDTLQAAAVLTLTKQISSGTPIIDIGADDIVVNGQVDINGGVFRVLASKYLYMMSSSALVNDPGDIVFTEYDGTEMGRFYCNPNNGLRWRNADLVGYGILGVEVVTANNGTALKFSSGDCIIFGSAYVTVAPNTNQSFALPITLYTVTNVKYICSAIGASTLIMTGNGLTTTQITFRSNTTNTTAEYVVYARWKA